MDRSRITGVRRGLQREAGNDTRGLRGAAVLVCEPVVHGEYSYAKNRAAT
jgi:hypothetical protein